MTSEGGGAVAFPVMTLALNIKPTVARDFSLMIQSCGIYHEERECVQHDSNPRNDCGSFHNILDANQTGEALFDILQQWCLRWNDLW